VCDCSCRYPACNAHATYCHLCVGCPVLQYFSTFLTNATIFEKNALNIKCFIFKLLCIVIDFFLNNQQDELIIPILFCYKTLHISGIFSARHQEFSTVHSALVSFMQVFDDRFQAESGYSILTLLVCRAVCDSQTARHTVHTTA
jgi:hypothetical protein